jgi:hypothetical protein
VRQPGPPPGRARARPRPLPEGPVRAFGYAAGAWCLGFAAVSAWQVAQPAASQRHAADASGLAIMSVLVGVLKLAGAAVALAAVLVRPGPPRRPRQPLGVALWGPSGCLPCTRPGTWSSPWGPSVACWRRRQPGPPRAA